MRSLAAVLSSVFMVAATAASAETRVFIVANQADGYGVDQCLASGEKCGASAARSYCQSRDFAQASSIPTRSPARFPRPARTARTVIAINTSQLPASAETSTGDCGVLATSMP
jgi:hypothetical protein